MTGGNSSCLPLRQHRAKRRRDGGKEADRQYEETDGQQEREERIEKRRENEEDTEKRFREGR